MNLLRLVLLVVVVTFSVIIFLFSGGIASEIWYLFSSGHSVSSGKEGQTVSSGIEGQKILEADDVLVLLHNKSRTFYSKEGRLPTNNEEAGLLPPEQYRFKSLAEASIKSGGIVQMRFVDVDGRDFVTLNYHPMIGVGRNLYWLCRSYDYEEVSHAYPYCKFESKRRPDQISPSFDCKNAKYAVEYAICSDVDLAVLDWDLNENYRKLSASLYPKERNQLVNDQRIWLRERQEMCRIMGNGTDFSGAHASTKCLMEQYERRIAYLASLNSSLHNQNEPVNSIGW